MIKHVLVIAAALTVALRATSQEPGYRLGVWVQEGSFSASGAQIVAILPDGPASVSALQAGDLVLSVQGERVESANACVAAIRMHCGREIRFTVFRDGPPRQLDVRVPTQAAEPCVGINIKDHSVSYPYVSVRQIDPNSPAARFGLRIDDYITRAGGSAVSSTRELQAAVNAHGRREGTTKPMELWVLRGGESLRMNVPVALAVAQSAVPPPAPTSPALPAGTVPAAPQTAPAAQTPPASPVVTIQELLREGGFEEVTVDGRWNDATEKAVDKAVADLQKDGIWSRGWNGSRRGAEWSQFSDHLRERADTLEQSIAQVRAFAATVDQLAARDVYTEPEACGMRHGEDERPDAAWLSFINGLAFEFGDEMWCAWISKKAGCRERSRFLLGHFLLDHSPWPLVIPNLIGALFCPIGLIGIALALGKRSDLGQAFVFGFGADLGESVLRVFGELSTFGTLIDPWNLIVFSLLAAGITGAITMFVVWRKR